MKRIWHVHCLCQLANHNGEASIENGSKLAVVSPAFSLSRINALAAATSSNSSWARAALGNRRKNRATRGCPALFERSCSILPWGKEDYHTRDVSCCVATHHSCIQLGSVVSIACLGLAISARYGGVLVSFVWWARICGEESLSCLMKINNMSALTIQAGRHWHDQEAKDHQRSNVCVCRILKKQLVLINALHVPCVHVLISSFIIVCFHEPLPILSVQWHASSVYSEYSTIALEMNSGAKIGGHLPCLSRSTTDFHS